MTSYKCRLCRLQLFASAQLYSGEMHRPTCECSTYFIDFERISDVAVNWIHAALHNDGWTRGKLMCPKCAGRVGSFDVVNGLRCACGRLIVPGIAISKKRIDECNNFAGRTGASRSADQPELAHATDLIGAESLEDNNDHIEHTVHFSDTAQEVWRAPSYFTGSTEDGRGDVFGLMRHRHSLDSKHFAVWEDCDGPQDGVTDGHCCTALHAQTLAPELDVLQITDHFSEMHKRDLENWSDSLEISSCVNDAMLEVTTRNCKTQRRGRDKKRKICPTNVGIHKVNEAKFPAEDGETGNHYAPSNPEYTEACVELECPICLDLLCRPQRCGCGHSFCKLCLKRLRHHSSCSLCCPVCRQPIKFIDANNEVEQMIWTFFPEKYKKRLEAQRIEKLAWNTASLSEYYSMRSQRIDRLAVTGRRAGVRRNHVILSGIIVAGTLFLFFFFTWPIIFVIGVFLLAHSWSR